jgi:hypothetical protein
MKISRDSGKRPIYPLFSIPMEERDGERSSRFAPVMPVYVPWHMTMVSFVRHDLQVGDDAVAIAPKAN